MNDSQTKEILMLFSNGISIRKISVDLNIGRYKVRKILQLNNIPLDNIATKPNSESWYNSIEWICVACIRIV